MFQQRMMAEVDQEAEFVTSRFKIVVDLRPMNVVKLRDGFDL